MDSIITTDLKTLTLNSSFLILKAPNGEIEIDIKKLLKEPINSDNAYFNATQIAKMYNKNISQWIRLETTKEYLSKIEKAVNLNTTKSVVFKPIKTIRGKHHSGTWLHSKVILKFLRWINVDIEIAMDLFIQDLIIHSNELKIERGNTKALFKPLTQTIKDIYIPNQISANSIKFAYSTLLTLANIKVLGNTAKKYAKDNNIEVEDGKTIRDYLPKEILEKICKVEEDINGFIKYGKVYKYDEIKNRLEMK